MKKKLFTITWILCILVGIILIALPTMENIAVQHLVNQANSATINTKVNHHQSHNFNFSNIKKINASGISNAFLKQHQDTVIGKIAIPSVKIKLPIYYGLNNRDLLSGVGTMKANQSMGKGNYVLAGHHMNNEKILFGSLHKVHLHRAVYLTDGDKVYTYRVIGMKTINEYQTHYVTNHYSKPTLTLITCASGTINEPNRTLVRAQLSHVDKLNHVNSNYFN